ncbi:amidohydrolase family protein [Amycolatopsis pithecellobii]|uniref:Amidohydrolase family protein n=1 Tax=Amycolatopsis pithecellobii TaxID=664692 RepID=A0A6N7YYL4_9PSEU|nr:amidohydrolase family protein [Amycolatopsis pithecellobii]MTD52531.1 amidohydrolase family protein [Amycolatopsis pithecellobii]
MTDSHDASGLEGDALRLVGLEEHIVVPDVLAAWKALDPVLQDFAVKPASEGTMARQLADLGDRRVADMTETGLDVQVLSMSTPGLQSLDRDAAVILQQETNELIAEAVRSRPDRYQGLATLATPAPEKAARELERAVTELGLDGAMLFGRTRDENIDDPRFWPIFEAASALHAPLYLHPQTPSPSVREAYYSGLGPAGVALGTHRLGWHYETGVQLLRLILAGVFDRFPDLQVVVGHWGESVLFYLERLAPVAAIAGLERPLVEYFRNNIWLTPSGMFSQRYLRWAIDLVGVDRIMFATDYPFEFAPSGGARRFLQEADLSDADRVNIASGNWERLRADIRR